MSPKSTRTNGVNMKSINMKSLIIGLVLCGCVTGTWTGPDVNIDASGPIIFSNIKSRV